MTDKHYSTTMLNREIYDSIRNIYNNTYVDACMRSKYIHLLLYIKVEMGTILIILLRFWPM